MFKSQAVAVGFLLYIKGLYFRFRYNIGALFGVFVTANQITWSRLIFSCVLIPVWVYGDYTTRLFVISGFVICWIGDWLDGAIADATDTKTNFGKWFDPLVDKIQFYTTVAIFWNISSHIALCLLFVLDVFSTIERGCGRNETKTIVGANWFGKWKTGFQISAFFLFIFSTLFSVVNLAHLANVVLWVSFLCSITSILNRLHNLQNEN